MVKETGQSGCTACCRAHRVFTHKPGSRHLTVKRGLQEGLPCCQSHGKGCCERLKEGLIPKETVRTLVDGRLENVRAVFPLLHLIALEMGSRVQTLHVLKVASTPSMYELYILPYWAFWVLEESSKSAMQSAGVFHSLRNNDKDNFIFPRRQFVLTLFSFSTFKYASMLLHGWSAHVWAWMHMNAQGWGSLTLFTEAISLKPRAYWSG